MDGSGDAYVTGETQSTNFPTVNALQPTNGSQAGGTCIPNTSPCVDAFISELNPTGSTLLMSTYLGGKYDDFGQAIALDHSGELYVTGETASPDFPTVHPIQSALNRGINCSLSPCDDAFVSKIQVAATSGRTPWHPHHTINMGDGVQASIDLADGHVDMSSPGVSIPGRGLPLTLGAIWDSVLAGSGITTTPRPGLTSDLAQTIGGVLTGTVTYTDATGLAWVYVYSGTVTASPPYTSYVVPAGFP